MGVEGGELVRGRGYLAAEAPYRSCGHKLGGVGKGGGCVRGSRVVVTMLGMVQLAVLLAALLPSALKIHLRYT